MPRAKARYKGDGTGTTPRDFSPGLKNKLRKFHSGSEQELPIDNVSAADEFVEVVLAEARIAIEELHWMNYEITRQDLRQEHKNLSRVLTSVYKKLQGKHKAQKLHEDLTFLQYKLHHISPGCDRLLGVDADPLGCADELDKLLTNDSEDTLACENNIQDLLNHLAATESRIDQLERKPKKEERRHEIALEMTIRVLRVLMTYGKSQDERKAPSSYLSSYDETVSKAISFLKAIGDDIDLKFADSTWRDFILEAKKAAPELKKI